jgi:hypothetical protein
MLLDESREPSPLGEAQCARNNVGHASILPAEASEHMGTNVIADFLF